MSAGKTLTVFKLLAKNESTYGTVPTLADASDAVQVAEQPTLERLVAWDGERPDPPGTGGLQVGLAPQGLYYNPTFKVEEKAAGTAYSASNHGKDTYPFLRACGFDVATTTTGGAEKDVYTPTAETAVKSSLAFEAYGRCIPGGNIEKWVGNGGYCDFVLDIQNGQQAFWTFTVMARENAAPTEVSWSAPTYSNTVIPPIAAPIVFSFNAITSLTVRSVKLTWNREIVPRFPNHNTSGGHAGFHPGRRKPELVFVCEAPAKSTLDFDALHKAATGVACSYQVGSVQYNQTKFAHAQVQVKGVKAQSDGQIPLLEVTCRVYNSTPGANDDLIITRD